MKQKRLVAALLTLVLLAGLTGCARKSRRPALPAARGIALGEAMQSVFSKMPAYDTTLKKWAVQEIYGWADPSGGTATLSFVADSFYTLDILTPGGRCFNITFARIDNSVKWMDVS